MHDIVLIQQAILKLLCEKGIIIETLPTSNVRIGHYEDYSSYHLWTWEKWRKEKLPIPDVSVGSDDTGIFATSIFNEYANIYCSFTKSGSSIAEKEALHLIRKLEDAGNKYRFS